ncbi:MAG: ABC transporter ATP-binding protein/permease [Firmicutes bacterium]|nr:ABC transporter ATP-binding protein/permease [Bacillota bacterium]
MAINTFRQDEITEEKFSLSLSRRLVKYLKAYSKTVLIVLLLLSFTLAVELINPFFLQIAIDHYIDGTKNVPGLLILAGGMILLSVLAMAALKIYQRLMGGVTHGVLRTIRRELFSHLQKLSFNFFDNRPTGKILARVIGDINSLRDLIQRGVLDLIPNLVKILCVIVIMLVMNVKLALYAFVMLPFLAFGMIYIQRHAHHGWRAYRVKTSNLNAFTHEAFSGVRVVQSFGAERQMNRTFERLTGEQRDSFMKACRYSDMFWPCVELSWGIGSIIVYWAGVWLLNGPDPNITVGLLVAFSSYIAIFWQPIMNLSNFYNSLVTNLAAAERVFEIMDTEPDIRDASDAEELPPIAGAVEFRGVTFGYDPDIPVLKDVSFQAEPGQPVALVGPTGAGKTSIINLLGRFYDLQAGRIFIDGHDISKVTLRSLRAQMVIMPQDTFLFSGSVRDNIRYGRLDATDAEIEAAAKAVCAHEFIMGLENGYDTAIQERGGRLSVGQRQLVAFARAMLADPKILVLDEATSSIDTHTERLVQQGIRNLLRGRTSFVIAHRLSTIRQADQILVIDDGQLVESGTHGQLMDARGMYYHLFMAQFRNIVHAPQTIPNSP